MALVRSDSWDAYQGGDGWLAYAIVVIVSVTLAGASIASAHIREGAIQNAHEARLNLAMQVTHQFTPLCAVPPH